MELLCSKTFLKSKLPLLTCFVLWFDFYAFPQQRVIDSLQNQLSKTSDEREQLPLLLALVAQNKEHNPNRASDLAKRALLLAVKTNSDSNKLAAYRELGYLAMQRGDYSTALEYNQRSLSISIETHKEVDIANSLDRIGLIYFYMDDYSKANGYFLRAKQMFSSVTNEYIKADVLINLSRVYYKTNQLDSALVYCKKAFEVALHNCYLKNIGLYHNTLGETYAALGHKQKGLQLMQMGLRSSIEQNNIRTWLTGILSLARFYTGNNQPDSALSYLHVAVAAAQKNGYAKQLLEAYALLSSVHRSKKNIDSAFLYLEQSNSVREKLFNQEALDRISALEFTEQLHKQELKDAEVRLRDRLWIYGLLAAFGVMMFVAWMLYRHAKQKQKAYELLQQQKQKTDKAYQQLESTQAQLVQREKMASLGELTAGIAHEIQNPLNFVNNFAEANKELLEELELANKRDDRQEVKALAADLKANEEKITYHGKRADSIVKGMLQHTRASTGEKERTDINMLVDEYLRLSYQGMRAKNKNFNATIQTSFDENISTVNVVRQDIGRVLLNLYNNAFYATQQKKAQLNGIFEPKVTVSSKCEHNNIQIVVKDNGCGISQKAIDKVFQPFFTTKPTGEGTGLGLSLSYDIITKGHGGQLTVQSNEGEGAEFTVALPLQSSEEFSEL